jgi:hypothetical protein
MEFFSTFFKDLVLILTEPRAYFRQRYPALRPNEALAFGILASWLAAFLGWITRVIKHETLFDGLNRIHEQLSTLPLWRNLPETIWQQGGPPGLPAAWKAEVLAIILTPFQSLIQFCVYGVLYFLGALVLIRPDAREHSDRVSPAALIRLCAVSAAPAVVGSILGFLPLGLGGLIGWIYGIAILTIGISERHRVSSMRALGVILIPGITGMVAIGCFLGVLAVVGVGIFRTLFGGL